MRPNALKSKDQTAHEAMIQRLVARIERDGFVDVQADVVSYDRPPKIYWKDTREGHVPDVTATKDGVNYTFAVETGGAVSMEDTQRRWRLLAGDAEQHGKRFIAVVPAGRIDEARRRLNALQIDAEVWPLDLKSR